MMTGAFGGTYEQFGADLASVLDDGDNLRLLPIVGRGSVQGVADILFLKGVDLGIVRADTLDYIEKKGYASNIKKQFNFIAKLYNEEMHVVAAKSIRHLCGSRWQDGRSRLGEWRHIRHCHHHFRPPQYQAALALSSEQRVALEKLKKGEIDAVIAVDGKPLSEIAQIDGTNLHLVPVDYVKQLQADYLPTRLTAEDYPNLIAPGQSVDTVAVAAVLAAYNWAPGSDRYRRLSLFVYKFFAKVKALQRPPFHPKWREVALSAPLAGWTRLGPAEEWLDRNSKGAAPPLAEEPVWSADLKSDQDRELFRQFLEWRKQQLATRHSRAAPRGHVAMKYRRAVSAK